MRDPRKKMNFLVMDREGEFGLNGRNLAVKKGLSLATVKLPLVNKKLGTSRMRI